MGATATKSLPKVGKPAEETKDDLIDSNFQDILTKLGECDQNQIRKLSGMYALVRVSTHRWRGRYKIRKAEVIIAGDDMSTKNITSRPYWHLMPPTWESQFVAIEQQKDAVLQSYSAPSNDLAGVRVILADKLEECCDRLNNLEDKFKELATLFTSDKSYTAIFEHLENQLEDSPAALQEARAHVPPQDTLRASFRMDRIVIPTALPSWAAEGDDFYSQELKRSERRLIAGNLTTLVQRPREELAAILLSDDPGHPGLISQLAEPDATGDLVAREGRRLAKDSFNGFKRQLDAFTNFDDLVDEKLLKHITGLRIELDELVIELEEASESKKRLPINTNEALAVEWARKLTDLHAELISKESMSAGLRKLCLEAGVKI